MARQQGLGAQNYQGSLNQGAIQNQMYQGMAQQGLLGQAQSLNAQMQMRTNMEDPDYDMFLKYAQLEDGDMIRMFLKENKSIVDDAEAAASRMIENAKAAQEKHESRFYEWCAKFKRHITKDRVINKLKAFL
jgi:hypothetical protein